MLNRKGQSTVEYALIIAVVVAGLLLMQHYIKRGYAGKLKSSADDMGEQFDPASYTASYDYRKFSNETQTVKERASETKATEDEEERKDIKQEDIAAWGEDEDLYSR